jgi:hypothetical protein
LAVLTICEENVKTREKRSLYGGYGPFEPSAYGSLGFFPYGTSLYGGFEPYEINPFGYGLDGGYGYGNSICSPWPPYRWMYPQIYYMYCQNSFYGPYANGMFGAGYNPIGFGAVL